MTAHARPLTDLLRLFVGPALWFGHFTALYGAEALICTPPVGSGRAMSWFALAATIAALGMLAAFGAVQARRLREEGAFGRAAALLLTMLSALGVVWTALPVALLPVCAGG
jgi:hypothetical protein